MKSRLKEDAETVFNILRLKSIWDIQVNTWNGQLNVWAWHFKYRWVLQIEIQESVHTEKVFQVVGMVLERFNRKERRSCVRSKGSLFRGHWATCWLKLSVALSITEDRFLSVIMIIWFSLVAQMVKNLPECERTRFNSWIRKIPWRREWQPTPVFLPGESNGRRKLAGYSLWGHKKSDTTEWLTVSLSACSLTSSQLIKKASQLLKYCKVIALMEVYTKPIVAITKVL